MGNNVVVSQPGIQLNGLSLREAPISPETPILERKAFQGGGLTDKSKTEFWFRTSWNSECAPRQVRGWGEENSLS